MEPQSSPSPEQLGPLPSSPEVSPDIGQFEAQPEQAPSGIEREQQSGNAANQNQSVSLPQVQHVPEPVTIGLPAEDTEAPTPPVAGAPLVAADNNEIEKEWVDKAKDIVKNTRNDPAQQNSSVSHLKADYMHKRFGKKIKLSDDKIS